LSQTNGEKTDVAAPLPQQTNTVPEDPQGEKCYPTLFQLLTPRFVDGKCTRLAGSLSIRPHGSIWVVTVNCPTEEVVTKCHFATLAGLLDQLERHVANPLTIWLPDYASGKRARQEVKRLLQS